MNSLFEVRLSKSNKQESSTALVTFLLKIYPNVMIVFANCEKEC